MTTMIPPIETRLLSPDGQIERGVGECTALSADEDVGAFVVGGYGFEKDQVNPRSLWRKSERKEWSDFMRLYKKMHTEPIPILRKEARDKLLKRFGTTEPAKMELLINIKVMSDPRLDILTKRGTVKTTTSECKAFSMRFASSEGSKK